MEKSSVLNHLVHAGGRLSAEADFRKLASVLVEQSADHSRSDLACFYAYTDPENPESDLRLIFRRGLRDVPSTLPGDSELMEFVDECREALVLLSPTGGPFDSLFLAEGVNSGMMLPIRSGSSRAGVLVLNSRYENHYGSSSFHFQDSLTRLAGGLLQNARLMKELKDHLKRIEEMERYQSSIFRSMTNLLITLDEKGAVRYFNRSAAEAFDLSEDVLGTHFSRSLGAGLGDKVHKTLEKALKHGLPYTAMEGIYSRPGRDDMDYSLNAVPLKGLRGKKEGLTLLFTDQNRERTLKEQAGQAVEQRRHIKDMFSRCLSQDLVKNLTDNPELVKPGGEKKTATVFFADITGYTAFSEGRDPRYVIEVLNEFFNEAVELVIDNNGYIDKFIGDCIMAAWGVPMKTEEEDAVLAVTTALQIHDLVRSEKRGFFHGDAEKLKISIGMASGPLVAGNVGSSRRMDYTVLGDTVNTAARLESVATAEEVIITRATRDLIGDRFHVEEREPVRVKGKEKPLTIFNVKGIKQ